MSGLTPATLGKSASLQVGQQVVAIGSPQGLTGTVTNGIVSAFNRTVTVQGEDGSTVVYNGMQTDAPINPGNSGGPLVNLDGQVVGINSAIATSSSTQGQGGSIGLGFAIPIDQATRVAQEIMQNGSATKPVLGVTGSVRAAVAAAAAPRSAPCRRARPPQKAGLAAGDVVTKVGDAKVEDFADLIARIGSYAPGAQVSLTVQSGGASKTVQVTLGSQTDKAATTGTGGESQNPFGGQAAASPSAAAATNPPPHPLQQGDIAPTESPQCHPAAFCLAPREQLEDRRVGLAAALAHRLQAVADAVVAHVVHQRRHQPGAAAAERVAERDRPAVQVERRRVCAPADPYQSTHTSQPIPVNLPVSG